MAKKEFAMKKRRPSIGSWWVGKNVVGWTRAKGKSGWASKTRRTDSGLGGNELKAATRAAGNPRISNRQPRLYLGCNQYNAVEGRE